MPFRTVRYTMREVVNVVRLPRARFPFGTLFGERIHDDANTKQATAYECVRQLQRDGEVLLTDGSSTFYIGQGIARRCQKEENEQDSVPFNYTIHTNNLALSSEIDSWEEYPDHLSLKILGGLKSKVLNATFSDAHVSLPDVTVAFVSVRELCVVEGPTSPDPPSRLFKGRVIRRQPNYDLKIVTSWEKLSLPHPVNETNVVLTREEWKDILDHRMLTIVCDKPRGNHGNSHEEGQRLQANHFRPETSAWGGTDWTDQLKRYQWTTYELARRNNVKFVEVDVIEV